MTRKFNGTSDTASFTCDLSAFTLVAMSFWAWFDAYTAGPEKPGIWGSASPGGTKTYYFNWQRSSGTVCEIGMTSPTNQFWADSFVRPSAAAWHHLLMIFNRATPLNTLYLDGTLQTLTTLSHVAQPGNFASNTNRIFSNGAGGEFGAGRIAELALWGGETITAVEAKALAAGASPLMVHPDGLKFYAPMLGDSPEPDFSGAQHSVTLTGTSVAAHPPVCTLLRRFGRSSFSG